MKKISIKSWLLKLQIVAQRFPFTLFFILGLSFLFFLEINKLNNDIQPHTWTFFSLGVIVSLAVSLYAEDIKRNKMLWVAIQLVSISVLLIYCYTLPEKFESINYFQSIAIGVSFVLTAFFASFLKKNTDVSFWEFSKTAVMQLVIAFVLSQVLMLGLSLAVLSLQELFHIDIKNEVYQNLAVICYALFAPIYFLSNIPYDTEKYKEEFQFAAFLKILGLYILFPILMLYTLILYVYLAQIIVKWELPNGWVSTLVSVLGLGGFITMFILYPLRKQNTNKWLDFFYRIFPLILFPLLVLMSIGIFRRFSDYGITINRSYVLLLNLWLYLICIYLFITKSNHLKWIVISFSTVLFFASIGPWSVYSITKNKLTNELTELFANAKMLENGKIPLKMKTDVQIDSVSQSKMIENIRYLASNYGKKSIQPLFVDSIENKSVNSILNSLNLKYESLFAQQDYVSAFLPSGYQLDIKGYEYLLNINIYRDDQIIFNDENVTVSSKGNKIRIEFKKNKSADIIIDLDTKIKELNLLGQKNENRKFGIKELTIDGKNYRFVISNINAHFLIEKSSFVITECNAQLFYKLP